MKKLIVAVMLMGCFVGPYGLAHTKSLHCPPGETLKNILLDTLTGQTYPESSMKHFSPIALKFNYHHYHWQLQMPFLLDGHKARQQAAALRNSAMGAGQAIAKKIDSYYYCRYPSLSKGIRLVLYTSLTHAIGVNG
ncbi:MAG: hypothetical protein ACX932_03205 [Gammaproteobacteria bacterium]